MELKSLNGHAVTAKLERNVVDKEPELVSPKTLAAMWDLNVRRIWEWVTAARRGSTTDPFPFKQFPGSRLIRIPLKEAREWCERNSGHHLA